MYALLLAVFGLAVDLFYRRRHLGGEVPSEGAVLLVANHPNGLIDPIVLARLAKRRVRPLAKEPLFRMPVISWLVRGSGALPVYRAKDGADTARNDATFRAVYAAFEEGECVALFPEGISYHLPSLQPLKTGAARMALGAEATLKEGRSVQVVPVGLIYDDKGRFRSELFTQVGAPLLARDYLVPGDEQGSVRALTAAIGESMRALTLNLERWEDKPLVELAERVFEDGDDQRRITRMQALAEGARALKLRDPARFEAIRERFARFHRWLQDVGLTAEDLDSRFAWPAVTRFVVRNALALSLGLVATLIGALAYAVPFVAVDVVSRLAKGEPDEVATKKVLAGVVFYPIWQLALLLALIAGWGLGAGVVASCALPFLGLYAERFIRHRRRAWQDTRAFLRLRSSGVRRRLELEREALRQEIASIAGTL